MGRGTKVYQGETNNNTVLPNKTKKEHHSTKETYLQNQKEKFMVWSRTGLLTPQKQTVIDRTLTPRQITKRSSDEGYSKQDKGPHKGTRNPTSKSHNLKMKSRQDSNRNTTDRATLTERTSSNLRPNKKSEPQEVVE
ncbi:hypothetical protein C922_05462 [Plasmodium inui San Antonio 1]|uniref:Uncharacterized protein n=1 Tax=Plasmodium inui San Antonio 1 TaxID=1237626 RepID=W7A4X7_9APIC|nr:hypothetical protein C922_05462 [Plasmodium inui San Antonio 1]EUD64159.1 hypothetical protein C922_05462 [Plasmodium inui San Antonio 1]